MTNWYRALSVFGGTSTVFSFFEDMIGAQKSKASERIDVHPLIKLKVTLITLWAYLNWNRKFAKYKREFNYIYSRNQQALSNREFADLGKFYLKAAGDFWKLGDITCRNDYYVMLLTGLVKSQLNQLAPVEGEDIFNSLLVGEEGIESVQPLISIINMAQMVRASAGLKEALINGTFFKEPNKMKQEFPGFCEAFEHHLKMYGDRGALELKLECKTFRQKPDNLAALIASYADSDITLHDMSKQRTQLRLNAEQKLASLLKGKPLKRMFMNYIVKKARFIKNRESGRLDRTRIYGFVREIFLRIAEEWGKDGVIAAEDDIFYLTETEVVANAANPDINAVRDLIERRKNEWADCSSREPSDRIFLRGDIDKNYIPQKEQESTVSEEQGILRGMGCTPGVVIGEAIVLKSPTENEFVKDKILVAYNTDPGWVFWIMASKGLIVEKGNLLSHTAIIGRELGIPTIVCVPGATEKIAQNSLIKMDGLNGTIQILEPGLG